MRITTMIICATLRSCVAVADEGGADLTEPALVDLRKAAAIAFFGLPNYDETSRLTIAERLPEIALEADCLGAQAVRSSALQLFRAEGFEEVAAKMQYADLCLNLVRRRPPRNLIDIVVVYFKVEKSGIACRYTFGEFARTEDEQKVVEGAERDRLFRNIQDTIGKVGAAIRAGGEK